MCSTAFTAVVWSLQHADRRRTVARTPTVRTLLKQIL